MGFIARQSFPDFSSTGPFAVDYFEQAQRAQQTENQEGDDNFNPDNAGYISYNLPHNLEGEYTSPVKQIEPKPKKSRHNKKEKKEEIKKASESSDKYEYQPAASKYTDYNIGKSSSTVSQHPQAPGYYQLTQTPSPSPYQKYSFQPVTEKSSENKFLDELISTVAPFNPNYNKPIISTAAPNFETQSSEQIPSHLKNKNCRRIRKHIPGNHSRRKREAMNCFVCEDAANNAKFTQCSYAVEPEPKNEYSGVSERYSTPSQTSDGFRYKRYSGDEYESDPYEYIKKRTQSNFDESEKTQEEEEYKIPDLYDESPDKSFSESQAEAVMKNPSNCVKEESKGMTCTICKDPKTGGNYEQCSYNSAPQAQKYAYVSEKKYENEDPNDASETKTEVKTKRVEPSDKIKSSSSENKPLQEDKYGKLEEFAPIDEYKANYRGHDKFKLSDSYNSNDKSTGLNSKKENFPKREEYDGYQAPKNTPKKLIDDEPYDIPKHFAESTIREQKSGVRGLEPSLYGSYSAEEEDAADSDSPVDAEADPYKDIDEYHFKLFPEFSKEESQYSQVVTSNPVVDNSRKDVEEVLAEFTKKDRSTCKKAEKKGMTCYLCVDEKGIQHEECMYVSESKPQASHVAYHEVKQISQPTKEQSAAATELKNIQVTTTSAIPDVMQAAASEDVETKVYYKPNSKRRPIKKVQKFEEPVKSSTNVDTKLDDESDPETPEEFDVGPEEGAFSAETRPVYSKALGVKLPRYMIEKSEFEKEFDEFAFI